jgi:hypothetical protein
MSERGAAALWWRAIFQPETAGRFITEAGERTDLLLAAVAGASAMYALYGGSMGAFLGAGPAVVASVKLPLLFLLTGAVAFPPFYAVNAFFGPKLPARSCAALLLLAASAVAAPLASFAPVSYFFTLTTSRTAHSGYPFLVTLHLVILVIASAIGLTALGFILRAVGRARGLALNGNVLAAAGALFGLAGLQMGWALRPWVGNPAAPYQPIRPLSGNFIEALWHFFAT